MRDVLVLTVLHPLGVDVEGQETKSVAENFVLHDGGVVPDVNLVDGHGWNLSVSSVAEYRLKPAHLGDHDPSQGICNRRIDTNEIELDH